ncbi:MAG: hypothetical protein AB1468_00630 [Candidatus Micrarchaeota archaeon]
MNWKIGLTLAVLIAAAMLAYGDQDTLVRFYVPESLSFTITYPATTVFILFQSTGSNAVVNASNQTSAQPIITYTNTGNIAEYYYVKFNVSGPPSGINMSCGPVFASWQSSCWCQGSTNSPANATKCCNITTTFSKMNETATAISATQTMWCWANFTGASAGTVERNITSNASST